jgi:murein DD-endopeptidase MepM/ murein hydrolase activator NlpD
MFYKKLFKLIIILFISFLVYFPRVFASDIKISNLYPKQGEIVIVKVLNSQIKPISLNFDGTEFKFYNWKGEYVSFIGFKVNHSLGSKKIEINFENGEKETRFIKVLERKKIVQVLKLSQATGETPQEIAKKMTEENKRLNEISSLSSPLYFSKPFGLPLVNNKKITTGYGVLRKDGSQETWHLGIDLDAPRGAPIFAINDGKVEFASSTVSYGNTIVINHGGGIFSLYLHLDKILVSEGEKVTKGKLIGYVGSTGYSTGPHLHLSLKVNGVSVDPLFFIKSMENFYKN